MNHFETFPFEYNQKLTQKVAPCYHHDGYLHGTNRAGFRPQHQII